MSPQMKGLTQFIMDLRNSKDMEEENKRINLEINNIQTKFSSSLNGYQKKKYICKLIYIYLLGYTEMVDFGLKESIQLINSNNYSEKQLGYLSVSILVNYKSNQSTKEYLSNLLDAIHGCLIKDLQSNDEDFNCLAIQFVSSNFNLIGDSKVQIVESDDDSSKWLELIDIMYSFCTSPIPKPLVKKKSSLALLPLLKLYPQVILSNSHWIPRLLTLIDEKDLGVVTSSVPIIQFIVNLKPQFIRSIMPSIANRLHSLIIEQKCPEDYFYYGTPAPWLIVKLLQLIEYCFLLADGQGPVVLVSELDSQTLSNLRQVVARSIHNASRPIKGLPNRNSQSSILFQAVSLAVFLDASPDAINGAIHALIILLDSTETNTRYLALDALVKLTARSASIYSSVTNEFNENLAKIFHLLYDKDISVRRKSLDLLYTICNPQTYNIILNKLLDYFPFADFSLRSELAIKIAILAEKFATDSTWYVTTMLKLLSIGGGSNSNGINYIGNEVWERIVQIIVNNEGLQRKSCKLILNLLKKPLKVSGNGQIQPIINSTSENLIKVAAFVLGEYGHLIADIEDSSPAVQFQFLYDSYFKVPLITRAMLLSTFLKFIIKFPDQNFVPDVVDLFEIETQSIDLEIQTRSYEYLKLATSPSHLKLTEQVIRPLPIFETKESPLMNRIGSVSKFVGRNRSSSFVNASKINNTNRNNTHSISNTALPISRGSATNDCKENSSDESNPFEDTSVHTQLNLSPNWYSGYHRMLNYDAGIFYENQLIKITYRILKDGFNITLKLTIINNSIKTAGTDITGFAVLKLESLLKSEDPNYLLNLKQPPESSFVDKTSMEISIKIRNVVENNESPTLSLSFVCGGSFNQLNLKFPVLLLKTLTPTSLNNFEDFKKRWSQIEELLGTDQGESIVQVNTTHRYNSSNVVRLLSRLGFSIVHSTPDTTDGGILVMGAGILHTQKTKFGLLATIKSVDDVGKYFEIVVRCTGGGIPEMIASTIKEVFSGKA